uniref:CPBP family glutamic-type intramembrane protease n=1 Tax=Paractinoplanes polyasparticus TaxID=2856853 RepID=UPI002107D50B|nr:CPBP family glutamic-type intramembrane protease [Actinoplanes polyasparticus]
MIFALAHGINPAFVTALVVGLIAAEVRRRSDSIWPGVLVHVVNNLVGQLIALAVL